MPSKLEPLQLNPADINTPFGTEILELQKRIAKSEKKGDKADIDQNLKDKLQDLVNFAIVVRKINAKKERLTVFDTHHIPIGSLASDCDISDDQMTTFLSFTNSFLDGNTPTKDYYEYIRVNFDKPSQYMQFLYGLGMAIGVLAVAAGIVAAVALAPIGLGVGIIGAGAGFFAGSAATLYKNRKWNAFYKTLYQTPEGFFETATKYQGQDCEEVISTPEHLRKREIDASYQVPNHHFGCYEMRGARPTQEDALTWRTVKEEELANLSPEDIAKCLAESYLKLHKGVDILEKSGSTASTTIFDGQGNLITATVGDSVAFAVIYDTEGIILGVERLNSVVHDLDNPKELTRITTHQLAVKDKDVGIFEGRVYFRTESINMTRSIGDHEMEKAGVIAEASTDITSIPKLLADKKIDQNKFGKIQVITTCDGFTDGAGREPEQQTKKAHEAYLFKCLSLIKNPGKCEQATLAKQLAKQAAKDGSTDNISVAVHEEGIVSLFDGHAGPRVAIDAAKNIGQIFRQECQARQELRRNVIPITTPGM